MSSTASSPIAKLVGALPADKDVRTALTKVLASQPFRASERLRNFLEFVVTETLAGRGSSLKEAVIGNHVYGRDAAYDPRIDSTVRVEARRLRKKLSIYYSELGHADPVRIELNTGTYQPVFRQSAVGSDHPAAGQTRKIFRDGDGAHIAIMPFKAISGDTESASFARGLTDELISLFVSERGVRLLPQTTVLPYKDSGLSSGELAKALGVVAVLQGVVHQDMGILHVTMEFCSGSGFVVYSDRFEAPAACRAALQGKVAATVRGRMRLDSSQMRAMRISPTPEAVEALALVYRARRLMDRQLPSAFREALQIFTEIAHTASDYCRGHTGIADCYLDMFRVGLVSRETAREHARPAIERAIAIDPDSSEAQCSLGTVAAWLEGDLKNADDHYRRALDLIRSARVTRLYGLFKARTGHPEQARELLLESRDIEPLSLQQDIAETMARFHLRCFGQAQMRERDEDAEPIPAEALVYAALAQVMANETDGIIDRLAQIKQAAFLPADLVYAVAEIEAWMGEPAHARQLLSRTTNHNSAYACATLAAAAGDRTRASEELDRALKRREAAAWWSAMDPRFDALRQKGVSGAVVSALSGASR